MRDNLSQQHPPPSRTNQVAENITDPWEENKSTNATDPKTEGWEAAVDIHPLIAGQKNSEIITLPEAKTSKLSPIELLVEDGLKIKAYDGGSLKENLKEALGLLCWMVNLPAHYVS